MDDEDKKILSMDWYRKQKADDTKPSTNEYYIARLIEINQAMIHEIEEMKSDIHDLKRQILDMEFID